MTLRWPVEPVSAVAARSLPEPGRTPVAYEMKWDGFRSIVWRTDDGVQIQSRRGANLTRIFPDLVGPLVAALPAKAVIDGEILVWDVEQGRCSFSLLQKRLTAGRRLTEVVRAHPAHVVAFDLLRDGHGVELLDQPLSVRRAKLQRLLRGAPIQVALCPQTSSHKIARSWLEELGVAGVEGIVVKPINGRYLLGSKTWTKVRARDTAEYVVGAVTGTLDRPESLLLGRFDDAGVLRFAGQTHRVTAEHRLQLTAVLRGLAFQGPGAGHPWPCPLPAAWTGQFGDRSPVRFSPVEPATVVEVEVDTALDGPFGRVRHRARMVRVRLDLEPNSITLDRSAHHT